MEQRPLKREEGTIETEAEFGHPEIRLHVMGEFLVRVPWHRSNRVPGEWYPGVAGPPIRISAIWCALDLPGHGA